MIIVGINRSHNASVVLMEGNEVIFHIENERLSNIKYDSFIFQAISMIKNYVDHIDILALAGMHPLIEYDAKKKHNVYAAAILNLGKSFYDNGFILYDFWNAHHQMHAASSFYNSGFDSALCVVKDGAGSDVYISYKDEVITGREGGTVFKMSYPVSVDVVKKHIMASVPIDGKLFVDDNVFISDSYSEGGAFEQTALAFGFTNDDAGKIMGMSAYGTDDPAHPSIYDSNGLINKEVFSYDNESMSYFNFKADIEDSFSDRSNFAYKLQTSIQDAVADEILSLLEEHDEKNLCLSGGFFLNCVSNYNLLKRLPKDVNIYVEPISNDAGTAIGAAKTAYYMQTLSHEISPQTDIFYGPMYLYTVKDLDGQKIREAGPEDVAKLIADRKIVAIYQGGSESGPRALGNRSILYDPRDPDGKDHVNIVKKREWFRPFAGSVIKEYAKEWFDLRQLNESKFMMFAVDVLEEKRDIIPAITHVDGSCRVQTVGVDDNKNFYDLLKEFYKITGVPIILNTSFNLAGECIVETLDNAIDVLKRSEIDFLYLPELGVLVEK